MLAAVSAGWAVAVSALVFPLLTINSDEGVYLLQADALRHGRLFPPAPDPAEAFRPWLSVEMDGGFVTKYTPVLPSIFAAADLVFGSPRAALAAIAAGLCAATYAIGLLVCGRRPTALLAAAVVACSPVVLIQTATFLPYAASTALLALFSAAFIAGVRWRRPAALLLSGLALGTAAFARPFDSVVFAAPLLAWAALTHRRESIALRRCVAWWAAGAAPPVLAMAAYFQKATGSLLRPPFLLLDDRDLPGFGQRSMQPGQQPLDFGPAEAVEATLNYGLLSTFWFTGGMLLLLLVAVATICPGPDRSLRIALALAAASVPAGYTFFWGVANALSWNAPHSLGPYYWMPALPPAAALGALGYEQLRSRHRLAALIGAALSVALAAAVTATALRAGVEHTRADRAIHRAVTVAGLRDALVFVDQQSLGHPLQFTHNRLGDPAVVWALARGECHDAAVAASLPDRKPYRLIVTGPYRRDVPGQTLSASVIPVEFDDTCSFSTPEG